MEITSVPLLRNNCPLGKELVTEVACAEEGLIVVSEVIPDGASAHSALNSRAVKPLANHIQRMDRIHVRPQ
ncbi:hypothetical protein Tco_1174338 [Tanacetum coccineum]